MERYGSEGALIMPTGIKSDEEMNAGAKSFNSEGREGIEQLDKCR